MDGMKHGIILATLIAASHFANSAEPEFRDVFVSGENGYQLIRTPQILSTKNDTLLVFAQGREGNHDQSGNDIILKRSTDAGETWSALQVTAEDAMLADDIFRTLMGDDVEPRRDFIRTHALEVKNLDI